MTTNATAPLHACKAMRDVIRSTLTSQIAIPQMRIGRNIGRRRRSDNHAGGGGGRTAGIPSAHQIVMRSKNCTRSGSRGITPPNALACCTAPGGDLMMTATTTEE